MSSRTNCASCHGGAKWTKSQVIYLNNPALDSVRRRRRARDPGLDDHRQPEHALHGRRGRRRHAHLPRGRRHVRRGEPDRDPAERPGAARRARLQRAVAARRRRHTRRTSTTVRRRRSRTSSTSTCSGGAPISTSLGRGDQTPCSRSSGRSTAARRCCARRPTTSRSPRAVIS